MILIGTIFRAAVRFSGTATGITAALYVNGSLSAVTVTLGTAVAQGTQTLQPLSIPTAGRLDGDEIEIRVSGTVSGASETHSVYEQCSIPVAGITATVDAQGIAAAVWSYALGTPVVGSVLAYLVGKLAPLGSASVRYQGPMLPGGTFTPVQGDAATLPWDFEGWTEPVPASVVLRICLQEDYERNPDSAANLLGEDLPLVPTLDGTTLHLAAALTPAQTRLLPTAPAAPGFALRAQVIAEPGTAGERTLFEASGKCLRKIASPNP